MQDLSFISNMSDEDAYLFKRCVRRLLDTTFLVKDTAEELDWTFYRCRSRLPD